MNEDDDFKELLTINIAGQDISWYDYERYMKLATPTTFRTLRKVVKTEEYARAIRNQMSPETKKALIWVTVIGAIAMAGIYIIWKMGLFEGGSII